MTLKTKTALKSEITAQFPDNSTGLIAPINLRNVTQDIVDSYAQSATGMSINVTDPTFGADPTGTLDSAPAIQAAINALPAAGGTVVIPPGTYKIGETITIGSGTATTASGRTGVRIVGLGVTSGANFTGFPAGSQVHWLWTGPSNGVMLQVNGPLQGWGLENIQFDGGSLAPTGMLLVAAMNGLGNGLTFTNCLTGVRSTTYDTFAGVGDANSMHNTWINTNLNIPVNGTGVILTGGQTILGFNALSNTCYDTWINTTFNMLAGGTATGLILQACDSNIFIDSHFFGTGTSVVFDYQTMSSAQGNWPSSNVFQGVDALVTGSQWVNKGTPAVFSVPGTGARPNLIYGLQEGNGGEFPNLANTSNGLPLMAVGLNRVNISAAEGPITMFTPWYAQFMRINYSLVVLTAATGGTIGVTFAWTDPGITPTQSLSVASATANAATKGSLVQGSVYLNAAAGHPVTYQVNFAGVSGVPTFTLNASFERLN
jgi:hypothetical protein